MDEHRFGLSPEEDQPLEPGQPAPPSGQPASTTPPPNLLPSEPVAEAPATPEPAAPPSPPDAPPPLRSIGGGAEPPRPPLPSFGQVPPSSPADPPVLAGELATYGSRVVGFLVDGALIFAASMVLALASVGISGDGNGSTAIGVVSVIGSFIYAWLMIGRSGQTVGMRVAKVRCVMADGSSLTMGRAAGRAAVAMALGIVPYLLGTILDLLFPAWDKKRQTLHDKAVGSLVVKVQPAFVVPDFPPPAS